MRDGVLIFFTLMVFLWMYFFEDPENIRSAKENDLRRSNPIVFKIEKDVHPTEECEKDLTN